MKKQINRGCFVETLEERQALAANITSVDYSSSAWSAKFAPLSQNWLRVTPVIAESGVDRIRLHFSEPVNAQGIALERVRIVSPRGDLSPLGPSDFTLSPDGLSAVWNLSRPLESREIDALSIGKGAFVGQLDSQGTPDFKLRFDILPGDVNLDGKITIGDFAELRADFGKLGPNQPIDFDGNGVVNLQDFGLLRGNFGYNVDPGSAAAQAYDLGRLKLGGAVNFANELRQPNDGSDWYKFEVAENSILRVKSPSYSENFTARVYYDSSGFDTPVEIRSSRTNLDFQEALNPGRYYIAISDGGNAKYEISLSLDGYGEPNAEAGDSAATATPIGEAGVLSFGETFVTEIVGLRNDPIDWYRFTVNANSKLDIAQTIATESLVARLYFDSSGIGTPTLMRSDVSNFNYSEWVPPGQYYLAVEPRETNGNSAYQVKLTLTPFEVSTPGGEDVGDTAATANPLGNDGVLRFGETIFTELVGLRNDPVDWYRFEVNANSRLDIVQNFATEGLVARLYFDSTGSGTPILMRSDVSNFDYSEWLPPGQYYLAVEPRETNGNSAYQVKLTLTPFEVSTPGAEDAGDTAATANPLGNAGVLPFGETIFTEIVGLRNDPVDWYRFEVNANSRLNVVQNFASEGLVVRLYYDSSGTGTPVLMRSEVSNFNFSEWLPPGQYYLALEPRETNGNSAYQVKLTLTPVEVSTPGAEDAGDTAALATAVGVSGVLQNGETFITEIVGLRNDPVDWYRFEVNADSQLNVSQVFATEGLVARLYKDVSGTPTLINSGVSNFDFTSSLTAGLYYLSVEPRDSNGNSYYQVKLTLT